MMTKRTTRFTAVIIALITLFTLMIPFSCRTYAADFKVSGSTKATVTFTVQTGDKVRGGNYIELETSKGVLNCNSKFFDWDSTSKNYGFYYVYVTNLDNGSNWWTTMYKKDITLDLKPNHTYEIVVEPRNESLYSQLSVCNTWEYTSWKKNATWSIGKTKGVVSCEVQN